MAVRFVLAVTLIVLSACGRAVEPAPAPFVSSAAAEAAYGELLTSANRPTPGQYGNGERMGFFRRADGTVWGLPLLVAKDGAVLVCAPPTLFHAPVTDTFPSRTTIIAATNHPTGWRGGTGDVELLMRDPNGAIITRTVGGSKLHGEPACRTPESPDPPRELTYYRLVPGR